MKGFILAISSLVVVALIIEIFCPVKVMKKSLYLAFSLVVLFVITSGARHLLKREDLIFKDYETKIENESLEMFLTIKNNAESQIESVLSEHNIMVSNIDLEYEISEFKISFTQCSVGIDDEEKIEETKKIIQNLTGLEEEEVIVYV